MGEYILDEEKLSSILARFPFTLNEHQHKFIVKFITTGGNWCLSGLAGSGKSTIMDILSQYYGDEIIFFASSGVASLNMINNISSGTTHSGLSLPLNTATEYDYKKVSSKCSKLFAPSDLVKIIVVDECFGHNSDNLDVIYRRIIRYNKRSVKRKARKIRLLMCGDPVQMVTIADDKTKRELKTRWGHHLMFMTDVWERFDFNYAVLRRGERQKDKVFKAFLDVVRNYEVDRFPKSLNWVNTNYKTEYPKDQLVLAATNKTVDKINASFLEANPNPKYTFKGRIEKKFNMKDLLAKESFTACKGLRVMTINNDSPEKGSRWVNGSLGYIDSITQGVGVDVVFDNGSREFVEFNCWENKERYVEKDVIQGDGTLKDEVREELLGSFTGLPLVAANSFSIVKSQGLTITSPFVIDLEDTSLYTSSWMGDFGTNFFYIAATRATSKDLITLATRVKPEHIKPCPYSMSFWEYCKEMSVI